MRERGRERERALASFNSGHGYAGGAVAAGNMGPKRTTTSANAAPAPDDIEGWLAARRAKFPRQQQGQTQGPKDEPKGPVAEIQEPEEGELSIEPPSASRAVLASGPQPPKVPKQWQRQKYKRSSNVSEALREHYEAELLVKALGILYSHYHGTTEHSSKSGT